MSEIKLQILTGHSVCTGLDFESSFSQIFDINVQPRMGQKPYKVLNLILAVLVFEHVYELLNPLLGELGKKTTRITQLRLGRVEYI